MVMDHANDERCSADDGSSSDDVSSNDPKQTLLGRRQAMQAIGGIVSMSLFSTAGMAASSSVEADTVVDLGEEGLSDGDVIDGYLEQYFHTDVEVHIPEGQYVYRGSGFGGRYSNAALVGDGEVVLDNEATIYRETIAAAADETVLVRNVTLRGPAGTGAEARFRVEAAAGGRVVIDNFNLPDGNLDGGESNGYYVPAGHAGVADFRNCYVANFSDNGYYASSPGRGANGQVTFENCVSHNNNISGIRLGSTDSYARNCLVLNDGPAPTGARWGRNMRGFRIRQPGKNIWIKDCEVINTFEGAGAPIVFHSGAAGGSGTIENVRVRNDSGTDAVVDKGGVVANWTADDFSVCGDGNLGFPPHLSEVTVGGDAEEPTGDDPRRADARPPLNGRGNRPDGYNPFDAFM